MKTQTWNDHDIRFVERDGEWWAVAKDVADAMGYAQAHDAIKKAPQKYKGTHKVPTLGGEQEMIILSEQGVYRLVMRSNKAEAEEFQDWVYSTLKELRRASGLEGYEIFRTLDKDWQREQTDKLRDRLSNPTRTDYIKANTIADKAISNKYGYPKMVKKSDMTPEMFADRQSALADAVELMVANEKYELGISVSKQVYARYTA